MKILNPTDVQFWKRLEAFCAGSAIPVEIRQSVATILQDIKAKGDTALLRHMKQIDGVSLKAADLRIPPADMESAVAQLSARQRKAIEAAIGNVRDFHKQGLPRNWSGENSHGAAVGERFYPIQQVGLYIPGGQVPLVSTVVMTATLAKLAKVPRICAVTPSDQAGAVQPALLAAFALCGVEEVYRVGGPMAVAALAYGTKTIPAVDKIFGPGSAYTNEAKRQALGDAGIDILAGPSEVMIIADASARPDYIAADLLAQAEHGTGREKLFLIVPDAEMLKAVEAQLRVQVKALPRAEFLRETLKSHCLAMVAQELQLICEITNYVAPEHLELQVSKKRIQPLLKGIQTAGAIFVGHDTPTAVGDFTAGPNHTLPTGRTGRFYSGLQITDFLRRSSVVTYTNAQLAQAAPVVEVFSELEQLPAHGRSVSIRIDKS